MRVQATGQAKFRVKATGKEITVRASELEWERQFSEERGMGPEFEHSADYDIAGSTVNWTIWEYPEGAENHRETEVPEELTKLEDIDYGLVHESDK